MDIKTVDDNPHDIYMEFGRLVVKQMLARHDGYIDFNVDDAEDIEAYSQIIASCTSVLVDHATFQYINNIAIE